MRGALGFSFCKYALTPCEGLQTHDLFKCKRCKGGKQTIKARAMLYGDTSTWVAASMIDVGRVNADTHLPAGGTT